MILSFSELIEGVQAQKEIFEKYLVYQMKNTISLQKEETEKSGIELLAGEIIQLGQKTGEIRTDLPKGLMEDLFVFAFIEVAKQFYMRAEKFNDRETIEQCVDLFINGVKAKKEEDLCKVSEVD
jgi:hypothetical protein